MVAVVVTAGCAPSHPTVTTGENVPAPTAVPPSTTLPTTTADLDTGDLVDPAVRAIRVDDIALTVAFVDRPAARARGLMGVEDLGDLDGMLFDLEAEREAAFTMLNTPIPLDIVFFAEDGRGVAKLTMEPCAAEPCPTYPSGGAVRYALEVPANSVELHSGSVLELP